MNIITKVMNLENGCNTVCRILSFLPYYILLILYNISNEFSETRVADQIYLQTRCIPTVFHRNSDTWKNCAGCTLSTNISSILVSTLFGTAIPTCSCNFYSC